ncbi:hypothetical protein ACSBR2_012867 [Camellia fascicularis]
MLQQLSESIDKKEIVKDKSSVNEVLSIDKQKCTPLLLERNYEFLDGTKKLIFKQGDVEKSIVSDLQKNLMSAVDNERLKIDMEAE